MSRTFASVGRRDESPVREATLITCHQVPVPMSPCPIVTSVETEQGAEAFQKRVKKAMQFGMQVPVFVNDEEMAAALNAWEAGQMPDWKPYDRRIQQEEMEIVARQSSFPLSDRDIVGRL